jgi:hypothetical protein
MPDLKHFDLISDAIGNPRSIISDGYQPARLYQHYELRENFFACRPLAGIMSAVGKRIIGLMRMQRKNIPEEYRRLDAR